MLTLCSPRLAVEMLSPIAVTETTEVGTGWERGDDGVGTARSAAGGARLYNLRLPSEGLRQGHGRVAGAGRRGAMLALCSPLLDLSRPYVSRMLPQVSSMSPMLAHVGPMLAQLGPILPLC